MKSKYIKNTILIGAGAFIAKEAVSKLVKIVKEELSEFNDSDVIEFGISETPTIAYYNQEGEVSYRPYRKKTG